MMPAESATGMPLERLLAGYAAVDARSDRLVTGLSADSRRIVPGHCFVALRGVTDDGARYVQDAAAAGAAAVLVDANAPRPARRGAGRRRAGSAPPARCHREPLPR